MDREPLNVVQVKPMPPEQRREPVQRVIEQVFMVNRIELTTFDHIQGVGKFADRDPGRLQQACKTGDKIINVVDVSDDVVRNHDICELAFAGQIFGASRPEKIVNCRHANGVGLRYRTVGRIDAEARNPALHKIAKQIPIIAGNLYDETGRSELVPADQRSDMLG